MKKGNRISFIVVIAILLMHMTLISSATPGLKDIDGHRAEKIIKEWWSLGVIKGTPNQLYHPDSTIKKSEMVALINRVLGYENQAEEPYGDVAKGAWYAEDFRIAKSVGYLVPYDNGNIIPDEIMTWEKALYSIDKAFRLPEATTTMHVNNEEMAYIYTRESIRRVVEAGGVSLTTLARFNPKEAITRAEFMEIMDSLIGYYINRPGTYQVPESTKGLVVVNSQDVVLKDSTVEKDLYITERVGEGDVDIKNTEIKGRALLQGGGENSIKLYNCKIKRVIVDRKRGKIRIVADKDSAVEDTTLYTRAKLEAKDGNVFESVDIDIDKYFPGFDVELEGNFGNVVVDSEVDIRVVGESKIKKVAVTNMADCKIELPENAKIESLQIDGATKVEGGGQLDNVAINVDNVKIDAKVDNVLIGDDVEKKPVINGEVVDKPTETKSRDSGSDSSGGGSDQNGDDTTNLPGGTTLEGYDRQVYLVESNDYYTLYSTSPLVKGLVSNKSTFVVEFKEGYVLDHDSHVKLMEYRDGYLRNMDHTRKALKTTSIKNKDYISRIEITPTLGLKYGRRYSLEFRNNDIYNTSNQKVDSELDVDTAFKVEVYTGEEGPLTLVDQLDFTITKYNGYGIDVSKYMYHSNKGTLVFSYKDQNGQYTESGYKNNRAYAYPLEATGLDTKTQITLIGAGNGITDEIPVYLRILDPVDMEYVVDQKREYIQVTFKNGLYGDAGYYRDGSSISLKSASNLKYGVSGQYHNNYIGDIVYKEGSAELIQSFKVYPYKDGQSKEQFKFDRRQGYYAAVRLTITDEKGTSIHIDGNRYKSADLLFKEKIYEDDYVIVSSSYPMVDGKLPVDGFIVMDFKEGYGGDNCFAKLYKPAGKDLVSQEKYYVRKMQPIKTYYLSPYQRDVKSYLWRYNSTGYSYDIIYSGMTNIKRENLGLNNVKKLNLTTEDYKGEKDILAIGQFINDRHIAIGQAFAIPLDQIFYSKTGEKLSYSKLNLDNECLEASINGSALYLKAMTPGTTTISFDITNGKGAVENIQFTVGVKDVPVIVKYGEEVIGSGETVGYLRVEANKDYRVLSEARIPAILSLLEGGDRYNKYMVEKESNGIFRLYRATYNQQEDAYMKIPFNKDKKYAVKGYINNFSNEDFYRDEFIVSDFNLITPPSFKKEIQIPKLTTGQVFEVDLKDYVEYASTKITYTATVEDENIAKAEILEGSILKITAAKTLPVDSETAKTTTSAVTKFTFTADDGVTVPLKKEQGLVVYDPSIVEEPIKLNVVKVEAVSTTRMVIEFDGVIDQVKENDFQIVQGSKVLDLDGVNNYTATRAGKKVTILKIDLSDSIASDAKYVQFKVVAMNSLNEYGKSALDLQTVEVQDKIQPIFLEDATRKAHVTTSNVLVLKFTEDLQEATADVNKAFEVIDDDGNTLSAAVDYSISVRENEVKVFFKGNYMMDAPDAIEGIYKIRLANSTLITDQNSNELRDIEFNFEREQP